MASGKYLYTIKDNTCFIKLVGKIGYTISPGFNNFLNWLFKQKNYAHILIDLSETKTVDSTNLGLLAKIAKFSLNHFKERATIVSTNENITAILKNMCLNRVFILIDEATNIEGQLKAMPDVSESAKAMAKLMYESHRNLVEISDENESKFRDVLEMLQERMKRNQG